MTQPQPMPVPPVPPPGAKIEQLRETVEVQARTIRYLLSNYEALLRKVERDSGELSWQLKAGTAVPLLANGTIPMGYWTCPVEMGVDIAVGVVFYSDGTMANAAAVDTTISPVTVVEIETEDEDEA